MKKLIEELEAKYTQLYRNGHDDEFLGGFDEALHIVKSHNPWHDVSELPPPYEQDKGRSIEVLILTEDGNIYIGVYVYEQKAFFILNRRSVAKEVKWAYLYEVQS